MVVAIWLSQLGILFYDDFKYAFVFIIFNCILVVYMR